MAWTSEKNVYTLIIDTLNYPAESSRFVVALNGELLPAEQWPSTRVNNGDIIDVLGAITGG
nr:sulfur carrier protein ThiS [Thalassolituus sp.]